ncbi:MAG: methionine aminotransferase [Lentisphaeraceae bacterium]|nr:methionine aminotransferase [Lentisphaeraceae bacterium]
MAFESKLANTEASIFGVMSQMAAEHGAINLSQGFPNFDVAPELIDLVSHYMKEGKNQYAPMPGVPELRQAISKKHLQCQDTFYNPDSEITITAGATQALAAAIAALVHPGDEIIVFEPTYDAYVPLIEVQGGKAVALELKAPNFLPDWKEVEDAVSPRTRGIILNTPHNPCGAVLTENDLNELAAIAKKHDLYVISDEVYEHIVFDDKKHISVGSHEELKKRTFVISSFGKTFHTTGWKCGYCLAPEELTWEFQRVHQFMVYSVNTPVQYAYADYLSKEENYLQVAAFYQEKRDFITKELKDSKFKLTPAVGSYFQLLDFSSFHQGSGMELAEKLVRENGVALIPLEPFYSKFTAPKLIRICFAKTNDVLKSGVQGLKMV